MVGFQVGDTIGLTLVNLPVGTVLDHTGASFAPVARNQGLDIHIDFPCDAVAGSDLKLPPEARLSAKSL